MEKGLAVRAPRTGMDEEFYDVLITNLEMIMSVYHLPVYKCGTFLESIYSTLNQS